jgi:MFS family permease
MKKKLNPLVIFLVVGIPLYFLANFIRNGIPGAIFNELQKDLNTTAKGVTALGASFMYVYALSQLITGVLCDRYGGYRTMLYGCPLFLIGVLAFPFVDNIVVLCLLRAIAAFGASIIYLSLAKEMTSKAPEHFSLLLGLVCFIGFLGGVTAGQPFSSLASSIGWKNSILGVGVIACLLYLAIPLVKKTQGTLPEIRQIPFSVKVFARIFKTGGTWRIVASFSIAYGVAFALCTVIAKKYLEDCCQYSIKASGIVMSLMFLSMAISSIGMGFLSKLFGTDGAYEQARQDLEQGRQLETTYYKGLGEMDQLNSSENQAALKAARDMLAKNTQRIAATAAVSGASPESIAIQKAANNVSMEKIVGGVAEQSTANKRSAMDAYLDVIQIIKSLQDGN